VIFRRHIYSIGVLSSGGKKDFAHCGERLSFWSAKESKTESRLASLDNPGYGRHFDVGVHQTATAAMSGEKCRPLLCAVTLRHCLPFIAMCILVPLMPMIKPTRTSRLRRLRRVKAPGPMVRLESNMAAEIGK